VPLPSRWKRRRLPIILAVVLLLIVALYFLRLLG
jgi:hypothetical protein